MYGCNGYSENVPLSLSRSLSFSMALHPNMLQIFRFSQSNSSIFNRNNIYRCQWRMFIFVHNMCNIFSTKLWLFWWDILFVFLFKWHCIWYSHMTEQISQPAYVPSNKLSHTNFYKCQTKTQSILQHTQFNNISGSIKFNAKHNLSSVSK